MTTFNYTTGNPSNLVGGGTASMNDIQGPFTDLRTWANGSIDGDNLTGTAGQQLGLSSSSVTRRGKVNIPATESRTNTAYGTMTTPDQVSGIVLPTDGLIAIMYHATWQNSVASAGKAAIFIGANQLQFASQGVAAPAVQEIVGSATTAQDFLVTNSGYGLNTGGGATAYTGDVTTGQIVGMNGAVQQTGAQAGPCWVFAAAGTYTISVQFKASSGSVTVKNRRLWVWTIAF
jgi:hypothetical protein